MREKRTIPLHPMPWPEALQLAADSALSLPLYESRVRAGFPSPADDYMAGSIDLNTYISPNPTATFLVKVEGDSMIGMHIIPGDLAVIDKSRKAKSGDIVLAYVNGEFTIKRFELKRDGAYLVAENADYEPMRITEADAGRIWGVVVGTVRTL